MDVSLTVFEILVTHLARK